MMPVLEWAASVLGTQGSSGAIDVVAIKKEDGTIECSPFHVKFVRLGKGKRVVKLKVNGKSVPLSMKLGKAGEAYFLERKKHMFLESRYTRRQAESFETSPTVTMDEDGSYKSMTASNKYSLNEAVGIRAPSAMEPISMINATNRDFAEDAPGSSSKRIRSYSAGDVEDLRPSQSATNFKKVPSRSLLMAMDKDSTDLADLNLTLPPKLTSRSSKSNLVSIAGTPDESPERVKKPMDTVDENSNGNTNINSNSNKVSLLVTDGDKGDTEVECINTASNEHTSTSESVHVILPSSYQSMSFSTSSDIARALAADYENRRRHRSVSETPTRQNHAIGKVDVQLVASVATAAAGGEVQKAPSGTGAFPAEPPPAPQTVKPFWTWSWGTLPVRSKATTPVPDIASPLAVGVPTPVVDTLINTSSSSTAATGFISIAVAEAQPSVSGSVSQIISTVNENQVVDTTEVGRSLVAADSNIQADVSLHEDDSKPIQVITSVVLVDDQFTSHETQKMISASGLAQSKIIDAASHSVRNVEPALDICTSGNTDSLKPDAAAEPTRVFVFSMCGHILSQEPDAPEPTPQTPDQLRALLSSYSISSQNLTSTTAQDPSLVAVVGDYLLPAKALYRLLTDTVPAILESSSSVIENEDIDMIERLQSADENIDGINDRLLRFLSSNGSINQLVTYPHLSMTDRKPDAENQNQTVSPPSNVEATPDWLGAQISAWSRAVDSRAVLDPPIGKLRRSRNDLAAESTDSLGGSSMSSGNQILTALNLHSDSSGGNMIVSPPAESIQEATFQEADRTNISLEPPTGSDEDQPFLSVVGMKSLTTKSEPQSPQHSSTSRRSLTRADPNRVSTSDLDRLRPENRITSTDAQDPQSTWRVAPVTWRESFNDLNTSFSLYRKPTEPYVEALSAYAKNDGSLPTYGKWDADESSFRSQNLTIASHSFDNSSDRLNDALNSSRQSPLPDYMGRAHGQSFHSDSASHVGLNIDDECSPSKEASMNANSASAATTVRPFSKSPLTRPMLLTVQESDDPPELTLPPPPEFVPNSRIKNKVAHNHDAELPAASAELADRLIGMSGNTGSSNTSLANDVETEQELEQEHLSLEDIPYDMISPEPAGGDFYDSDTDSYLSGSLSDSEPGAPLNIHKFRYRKVLVPSQEHLQTLELQDGVNEIVFEVEGHPSVRSQLFVWDSDSKIVIVDTEVGPIGTKKAGSGWGFMSSPAPTPKTLKSSSKKQESMPNILNAISEQGYKILYIAQQTVVPTKEYLTKLVAGTGTSLPAGPVFQSPDSLVRAFGAERTDLFKAAALRGLKGLFSPSHNPFFASFGVRPKDCLALTRCGVPEGRIFLTSPETGDVILAQNKTIKKSLLELSQVLQEMFPSRVPISDFNSASGRQPVVPQGAIAQQTAPPTSVATSVAARTSLSPKASGSAHSVTFATVEKSALTAVSTIGSGGSATIIGETSTSADATAALSEKEKLSRSQDSGTHAAATSATANATTPTTSNKTGKSKYTASKVSVGDDAFSDFGYWRVPIPLIDEK